MITTLITKWPNGPIKSHNLITTCFCNFLGRNTSPDLLYCAYNIENGWSYIHSVIVWYYYLIISAVYSSVFEIVFCLQYLLFWLFCSKQYSFKGLSGSVFKFVCVFQIEYNFLSTEIHVILNWKNYIFLGVLKWDLN